MNRHSQVCMGLLIRLILVELATGFVLCVMGGSLPWCIGRDFNEVWCSGERSGVAAFTPNMRKFNDFIEEWGLVGLSMMGACFT